MDLHNIKKIKGNKTKGKRRARGIGSGKGGHTMGKGMKGQNSRAGKGIPYGFEGGQVPFYKKIPELGGFTHPNPKDIVAIPLNRFNLFEDGAEVSVKSLINRGLIKSSPKHGVKIIAKGKLEKKLVLSGFKYTEGAKALIEKSGSTIK